MKYSQLIEIIVPVYNVEWYLPRCVESLIHQTYERLRIWLVDDGSTDNCPSICDEYALRDPRVVVMHKRNGGQSSARNAALDRIFSLPEERRGEWVAFVDSDDWVEPDFIEFLLGLQGRTGADAVQCGHWISYSDEREVDKDRAHRRCAMDSKQAMESVLRNGAWDVTVWNKLYRVDLLDGLRFPEGCYYEDHAIAPLLVRRIALAAVDMEPKYHYMQRYDSTANGTSWTDRKYDLLPVSDEMAHCALESHPGLAAAARERGVFARLSTLSQMVNTGHVDRPRIREMRRFVAENALPVLLDQHAAARVKLGVLFILPGFWLYRAVWSAYYSIRRRS